MGQFSKVAVPSTPTRTRWPRILDVFKPAGKRRRGPSPRFLHAILSTDHVGKVSVAIQNEDRDEDIIIVTTLSEIPFCCHADLLTMNREQLLIVAKALNAKLPAALRIDHQRTDAHIRNSIELIVGLRQNAPDAPAKALHDKFRPVDLPTHNRYSPMSPMSPLARRSRSHGPYMAMVGSPTLEILKEEVEEAGNKIVRRTEDHGTIAEPQAKRRRIDATKTHLTTPFPSNRRVTRSQSARTAAPSAPVCARILRSHSQKLPVGRRSPLIRNNEALFKTSTPKRILNRSSTSSSMMDNSLVSMSSSSSSSSPSAAAAQRIRRRKGSRVSEDDMEMTFGIEGMTMLAHPAVNFSTD